ncbi:hypothetical protein [Pyxidicoccus caerfyrddinensis]|nr:hypothetical protein [Pyxidicoccus caerfyrddinensis]
MRVLGVTVSEMLGRYLDAEGRLKGWPSISPGGCTAVPAPPA